MLKQAGFKKLWQDNKGFIAFVFLMLVFRSAIADWNDVPTGSMKPTILEGDRILVNKTAYDMQLPFTGYSVYRHDNPVRGDIVIFDSKKSEKRLVKRVIGIPGDSVEMHNNRLKINQQNIEYSEATSFDNYQDLQEDLLGMAHSVRFSNPMSALASFERVIVPKGFYLVMGDNRDNSADSRVIGFIPRDEIVGRANYVVFSLNYDNYYLPRPDRFFASL